MQGVLVNIYSWPWFRESRAKLSSLSLTCRKAGYWFVFLFIFSEEHHLRTSVPWLDSHVDLVDFTYVPAYDMDACLDMHGSIDMLGFHAANSSHLSKPCLLGFFWTSFSYIFESSTQILVASPLKTVALLLPKFRMNVSRSTLPWCIRFKLSIHRRKAHYW